MNGDKPSVEDAYSKFFSGSLDSRNLPVGHGFTEIIVRHLSEAPLADEQG